MTFKDFVSAVAPLAIAKKEVKDTPTWRIYHRALMRPPMPTPSILSRAIVRAASTRKWFPDPSELREDCETERQALLKDHPFIPCDDCALTPRWLTTVDAHGARTASRCPCVGRYQAKLAQLGVGDAPLVQRQLGEPDPENYKI